MFIFPPATAGPLSFRVTRSPRPISSSCSNNSDWNYPSSHRPKSRPPADWPIGLRSEDFLGAWVDFERLTIDVPLESAKSGQDRKPSRNGGATIPRPIPGEHSEQNDRNA